MRFRGFVSMHTLPAGVKHSVCGIGNPVFRFVVLALCVPTCWWLGAGLPIGSQFVNIERTLGEVGVGARGCSVAARPSPRLAGSGWSASPRVARRLWGAFP